MNFIRPADEIRHFKISSSLFFENASKFKPRNKLQ